MNYTINREHADNMCKIDIRFDKKYNEIKTDLLYYHNHSLYDEIVDRNADKLEQEVIWYKGTSLLYKDLFKTVDIYARSLKRLGYKKGDEIPICSSNIPQFVYIFLAASKIGAIINSFGEWFDENYCYDIIKRSESRNLFVSSDYRMKFEKMLDGTDIKIWDFSIDLEKSNTEREFIGLAQDVSIVNEDSISLEDSFTVTYTSGTTNPGRPKAVLHAVRSYMYLARYKDSDVSDMPKMRNIRVFSHIPYYVHASLSTSIVDPLFQGGTIIIEKEYNEESFPKAVIESKPNQVCASVGFWLRLAEYLELHPNTDMSFLYIPTVSGEKLSTGEEKYLNYIAKKYKFGNAKAIFRFIPVTFSIGGGTTESSGVLVTLFKSLQEKRLKYHKLKPLGLQVMGCASVQLLDGTKIDNMEVANAWFTGPCNMVRYYYDQEQMSSISFTDERGQLWVKMEAACVVQKNRYLRIVGRKNDIIELTNGDNVSFCKIEQRLYEKVPELLSCVILQNDNRIILHLKNRPDMKWDEIKITSKLKSVLSKIGIVQDNKEIYVRFHTSDYFKLAPSGKRDISVLHEQGIDKAVRLF